MNYEFKTLQKVASLIAIVMVFFFGGISNIDAQSTSSVKPAFKKRVQHARELLGRDYSSSVVRTTERVADIRDFVFAAVAQRTPLKYSRNSQAIAKAILENSEKNGFDPVFIAALIERESQYNLKARGSHGEIGLMQIKPKTAQWIAKKFKISYKGALSLENPVTNIRIGTQYIALLRGKFANRSSLYVSAYNMGATNVRRVLGRNLKPSEYLSSVMSPYVHLYQELRNREDTLAAHFRTRPSLAFNN